MSRIPWKRTGIITGKRAGRFFIIYVSQNSEAYRKRIMENQKGGAVEVQEWNGDDDEAEAP